MKKLTSQILLIIISLSCSDSRTISFVNTSGKLQFAKIDSIVFQVDNINPHAYLGHFSSSENDYIYFADSRSKLIHRYRFPHNKKECVIDIPPNIQGLTGFYVHSQDIILLQDNTLFRYFLIDDKGIIIDSIIIEKKAYAPLPQVNNTNPVYVENEEFYFVGYSGGEYPDERIGDRSIITKYSLFGKESENFVDYPDVYYKHNYGGLHYRRVYNTININRKSIILSFPVSHSIYVFQINDKKVFEYNTRSSFTNDIKPFSKKRDWYGALAKQDYIEYYYFNLSYAEIYYDKYRNLYYRIVELPNKNFDYHDMETYFKEKVVMILDNEFNYLGSSKINENIDAKSGFITQDGIYFKVNDANRMNFKFVLYSAEIMQ